VIVLFDGSIQELRFIYGHLLTNPVNGEVPEAFQGCIKAGAFINKEEKDNE